MSYLNRLITRATDTSLDLENNKIGAYRISPQHGTNIYVYHIYKRTDIERHICTITIVFEGITPIIVIDDYECTGKELVEVHSTLKELYDNCSMSIIDNK